MPKLNSRGDVAHGIGGGTVSLNNLGFSPGGSPGFMDDDTIAFVNGADAWIVSKRTADGAIARLADVSANDLFAGGWVAAWQLKSSNADRGLYSTTGLRLPDAGLLDVGRDGAIIYKPLYHSNGPTMVRELDGSEWQLTPGHAEYVHHVGQRRAIHLEGRNSRVVAHNLPQPKYVPGMWRPEIAFAHHEWWIAYYSGAHGIVLHPFGELVGFSILPTGNGWHTIRELAANIIRVAISWSEGEQPGHVRVRDYDVVNNMIRDPWGANVWTPVARVDILTINATVTLPTPPIVISPPLTPPSEVQMEDKSAFVRNHPAKRFLGQGETQIERVYNAFRFVCAVARDLGQGWGVQQDFGGDLRPTIDGVMYWGDGIRTTMWGVDIVADREGVNAHPTWGAPGVADPARFRLPPSDAEIVAAMGGSTVDPPTAPAKHPYDGGDNDTGTCDRCGKPRADAVHTTVSQPPAPPAPPPVVDLSGVWAAIDELKRDDAELRKEIAELHKEIAEKPAGTLPTQTETASIRGFFPHSHGIKTK